MTSSILAMGAVALALSLLALLALAHRWRRFSPVTWLIYAGPVAAIPVLIGGRMWLLPAPHLVAGAVAILGSMFLVARWRPQWNPPGQAFVGTVVLVEAAFVVTTAAYTFSAGLSAVAVIASLILVLIEVLALALLLLGTHEVVDVLARVRWERRARPVAVPDPAPFVSVQIASHNEPPELVLGSLRSLRDLDYPAYEVIVLDNNTEDESLWRPVQAYCEEVGFRFVRLVEWPGFKAGALNHGLEICDPRAEILAFVDADFVVEPNFLTDTVGFFADENIAIVQTTQDFRVEAERESEYLRRLALTYKAFDEITMPSRNERNAIIFAGTMGLIRRSALEEVGGWSEWCVTEDAETSLRILARGYSALYLERIYGRGLMPLTFSALKKQRFRWCFGGVQLLRRHWRLLLTGSGRDADGSRLRLTSGQRFDYLSGAIQWFQGLLTLIFSLLLLSGIVFEAFGLRFRLRPLVGLFIAVPLLLLGSGIAKSLWGLRIRMKTSWADAVAVMGIWLSLSWAVTLASVQAVVGKRMAFLRTPKFHENESIKQALSTTRVETPMAVALAAGAFLSFTASPDGEAMFLGLLCAWGALVYAAAPATALVAARVELSSSVLRRRRALEEKGPRSYRRPVVLGFATAVVVALLLTTASSVTEDEGSGLDEIFSVPENEDAASEPLDLAGTDRSEAADADTGRSASTTNPGPAPGTSRGLRNGKGNRPGNETAVIAPGSTAVPPAPQASDPPGPAPQSTGRPDPAPPSTNRPDPQGQPDPRSSPDTKPTPKGTPRNGERGPAD